MKKQTASKEHKENTNLKREETTDNSCGANCKWMFDEKIGTLFIKREEAMRSYEFDEDQDESTTPWTSFIDEIKHVIIDQQISTIGSYAFCNRTLFSLIIILDTVTVIGSGVFFFTNALLWRPSHF